MFLKDQTCLSVHVYLVSNFQQRENLPNFDTELFLHHYAKLSFKSSRFKIQVLRKLNTYEP